MSGKVRNRTTISTSADLISREVRERRALQGSLVAQIATLWALVREMDVLGLSAKSDPEHAMQAGLWLDAMKLSLLRRGIPVHPALVGIILIAKFGKHGLDVARLRGSQRPTWNNYLAAFYTRQDRREN